MHEDRFTDWLAWENRNEAAGISHPGIYICAVSAKAISGSKFSWLPEIMYIGMTNSISGLKGRLKQFDNTIIGKTGHGGADRVRYKYQDYDELVKSLYVAVASFECDVESNEPDDLRVMGEVAKFEYNCFASFVEAFGSLPEFNDKKGSPKYSLTIGRDDNS
jgi:hypothetical protein